MDTPIRPRLDLRLIDTPYRLLGAFLLVLESLLGIWLFRASDATERGIAGGFMALLFLAALLALPIILRYGAGAGLQLGNTIAPAQLPQIQLPTPAQDVKEQEVSRLPPDEIIGAPDGSFVMSVPPEGWQVQKELSNIDLLSQRLGISSASLKERLAQAIPEHTASHERVIVTISSERMITITPTFDRTRIDGRKFPMLLPVQSAARLAIIPIDRTQLPPLFVERPLQHVFLAMVGYMLNEELSTVHKLQVSDVQDQNPQASSAADQNSRQYLFAAFEQRLEDVILNGQERKAVTIHNMLVGMTGTVKDYLLVGNYMSTPGVADSMMEAEQAALTSLIRSFRPTLPHRIEEERRRLLALADERYAKFQRDQGTKFFAAQFVQLMFRLVALDVEDLEQILRAIKLIKPFAEYVTQTPLDDQQLRDSGIVREELDKFFEAFRQAEQGQVAALKSEILETRASLTQQESGRQLDASRVLTEAQAGDEDTARGA